MNNLINLIGDKRIISSNGCFHNERNENSYCDKIDKYVVIITESYCGITPICNSHFKEYSGFFIKVEAAERKWGNFYKIFPSDDEIINMILIHKQ